MNDKKKVMVKDVFLLNGGKRNTFAYVTHSSCSDVFDILKGPDSNYPVLKLGDDLSSRNRDMVQNMIYIVVTLKGQGHPRGQ